MDDIKTDGVAVEQPTAQPTEGQYLTEAQLNAKLEEVGFFSKNEALSEIKDVLTPLKNASEATKNMPWAEFVGTDSAKKVVDSFTGFREVQSKKSVLESNPRLGTATDKLTEAQSIQEEARKVAMTGDVVSAQRMDAQARAGAVASVIEAYDMK